MYRAWSHASVRSSCASMGPYPVKLQGAADETSTYRHFSYAWRHPLAWAMYMSIYSDVQIFAEEIFSDGCWFTKTANIKPRKNLSTYGTSFLVADLGPSGGGGTDDFFILNHCDSVLALSAVEFVIALLAYLTWLKKAVVGRMPVWYNRGLCMLWHRT